MITAQYAVRKWSDKVEYETIHGSEDGSILLCGKIMKDGYWEIIDTNYNIEITCRDCRKNAKK